MNNVEDKVVLIGLKVTSILNSSLVTLIRWFNNKQSQQKNEKADGKVKSAESKVYTKLPDFYKDQYRQGNTQFQGQAFSTQAELNKFSQLAKQYGISYLIEKRPFDLTELIQKETNNEVLTPIQSDTLNRWTSMREGERVISKDEYQVTLAVKDAEKIESLVKDLNKWRMKNLEVRLDKGAENMKSKAQERSLGTVKMPEIERGV